MATSSPTTTSSGGAVGSTATIIVAVTTGGSDASNINRPDALSGGDYSAIPYATLAAAISAIPKVLRHQAHVRMGAGTFPGATASGFLGGGRSGGRNVGLNIIGTTALFTPATGVSSGTAGAGTNSTTLVKPTAAANWTASDLIGKFVKVISGGGAGTDPTNFPVVRPITANTTTNITVEAIAGLDSTTVFQIVTMATLHSGASGETFCIQTCFNNAPVRIACLGFTNVSALDSLISSTVNTSLELDGVDLSFATDLESFLSDKDGTVLLQNCKLSAASDVLVKNNSTFVELRNMYCNGGSVVSIEDSHAAMVSMRSTGALSYALRLVGAGNAKVELVANNGAATAFYCESTDVTAIGTGLLSGSGNNGYGIQIEGSGLVDVAGSTITGTTGDILFQNVAQTWALAGSLPYGVLAGPQGTAVLRTTYDTAIKTGNYEFLGGANFGGRAYFRGYINPSFGEAVVNLANATPFDMGSTNRGGGIFNCTHASGAAILPDGSALGGVEVTIINVGSQTMTLQAATGGTISGTATVPAGTMAKFISLFTGSGKDFRRVAL